MHGTAPALFEEPVGTFDGVVISRYLHAQSWSLALRAIGASSRSVVDYGDRDVSDS